MENVVRAIQVQGLNVSGFDPAFCSIVGSLWL